MFSIVNIGFCILGFSIPFICVGLLRRKLNAEKAKMQKMQSALEEIRNKLDTERDDLRLKIEGLKRLVESELNANGNKQLAIMLRDELRKLEELGL